MSRLILTEFGTPRDAVRLEESPEPTPGPAEVVVRMEAATLNSSDFLLIRGQYGVRPALPSPVGAEGVGRVVDAGPDADQTLVGKRVIILPSYEQGTWAQHVVTGAHKVITVSDNTDPLQLAMIPINPATAYVLLSRFAELRTGDWVA